LFVINALLVEAGGIENPDPQNQEKYPYNIQPSKLHQKITLGGKWGELAAITATLPPTKIKIALPSPPKK
jgi:hypothetical protein